MLLLLLACPPADPPKGGGEVCNSPNPSSSWSGSTVFREATTEWGMEGVTGGRYAAGDLNGDGYPDLLVTEIFRNTRDDPANGVFLHRVLMNEGGKSFRDATVESGLVTARDGHVGTSSTVHVLGDVDNDGDLDVFAGQTWDRADDAQADLSELYLNDGTGKFSLAPNSDIAQVGGYPTAGASFVDANADGILDLWVTGFYLEYGYDPAAQAQLYLGNGDGTFRSVTEEMGLEMPSNSRDSYYEHFARRPAYGATACDVTGDGLTDLISTNYGRSWNHLWRNNGGSFTEISEEAKFDGDDNHDYTDNLWYACYCESNSCDPAPTRSCGGSFPDNYWTPGRDDQPVRLNGNSFTTVCGDIDNDGDMDLYTTEILHQWAGFSADGSQLLLNDGTGHFERIDNENNGLTRPRPRQGDWNEGDLHAAFFDFDNDGWKDILLSSSDYEKTQLWLWRQVSPGVFLEVSDATGLNQPWPAGVAVADFDRDGDLDVVTGSSNARSGTPWTTRQAHLYLNDSPPGNWIRLEGFPIGTQVTVTAGGISQTQEVSGGYGHFGIQNDLPLQFGLGSVCQVDEVQARYPGGKVKSWAGVAGNQAVTLK